MTTTAHLAATYQIGDPADNMVEIPDEICVCGETIVPLIGKVRQGTTLDWTVWIRGNYEHVNRPAYAHAARRL